MLCCLPYKKYIQITQIYPVFDYFTCKKKKKVKNIKGLGKNENCFRNWYGVFLKISMHMCLEKWHSKSPPENKEKGKYMENNIINLGVVWGFSRKTETMRERREETERERGRGKGRGNRFITGIGSHHLLCISWRTRKARDVSQSESDDLSTRAVKGVTPSPSSKAREPGNCWYESWILEDWEPDALMMAEVKEGENGFSRSRGEKKCILSFTFHLGPKQIGWCLPTLVRVDLFTQFAESNANLFQKHPHWHTQR